MNIARKLFYLLPAMLLFSLGVSAQATLDADFTVTPTSASRCSDSSFTFDASTATTYTGSGILTYTWLFGDATTTTGSKPTKTYLTAGKYSVKLVVTDGTLTDSIRKDVVVNPLPVAKFGFSSNNCQRAEMFFYDSSSVSSGYIDKILWTFEPGKTSSASTAIYVFNEAKTYNVKLEIWTDQGCYKSVTRSVVVRPRPDAEINYTSQCQGLPISFDAGSSTGTISSYKWKFPDGTTANTKTTSKTFSESGKYTVWLVTYNATSGCHDSTSADVTVYDNPAVDFVVKNTCQDSVFYIINKTKPKFGQIQEIFVNWNYGVSTQIERFKAPTNGFTGSDTLYHVYKPNPLKSYTIYITVRTTNGCEASKTFRAEVRGRPNAAFTTSGGCLDSTITFVDKSTIPTGQAGFVKYWHWTFGDSTAGVPNTSTLQNPTHKYKKAGTYKVTLIAATDAGCSDTVREQLVTVNPSPIAYFVYTTDCKNKPIQFKDTSVVSEGAVTGWKWNFGDSLSSSNTSTSRSPFHSFSKPGKYTVTLVAFSDKGCKDTFREDITIFPDATPDFTYTGACERSLITFTDNSTPPTTSSIVNYEWDFGDSAVDKTNSKVVSHAYQNSGKYTVRLTVTTAEGCPISIDKTVFVIPAPKASFTNTPTCIDKEARFTNTTTIVDPTIGVTYLWNFGDPVSGAANTSTLKNPTHTYRKDGQYFVKMVATSANGCKDSITKIIEAAPVPKADFSFVNLCNDSAMRFTDASSVSGSVITQRIWYWNDGSPAETSNNKTPSHRFPVAGKYDVSLVTVTVSGCRDSITKRVETFPKPTADFTFTTHCADTAITFTNTSTFAADTIYSYRWDFGDNTAASFEKNPSHKYMLGGAYKVKLYAFSSLGCADTIEKTVNVLSQPSPAFTPFGTGGNRCANKEITFLDDNPNGGIVSKFWNFGDGETSTENEPKHTYKTSGTFKVELTAKNANGCDSTIIVDVVIDELPQVKLGWVGGCAGEPVIFRDSSVTQSGKKRGVLRIPAKGFTQTVPSNGKLTYTGFGPGDAGIYDVVLTVTDMPNGSGGEPGCDNTDTFQIRIYPKPSPAFTSDIVCFGDATTLIGASDTALGGQIISWEWSFKDGTKITTASSTISHVFKKAGIDTVTLTITNVAGCKGTVKTVVEILDKPVAAFKMNPNPVSNLNPTVTFTNTTKNYTNHTWDFGDGFVSQDANPTHKYLSVGNYPVTLIVENAAGCRDTLVDTLYVKQDYVIHIPNVVTPNGDDVNDTWKPMGEGLEDYELIIMNRWGEVVFKTNDFEEYWKCDTNRNGVLVPDGVYVYYIRIVDFAVDDVDVRKGFINVIR